MKRGQKLFVGCLILVVGVFVIGSGINTAVFFVIPTLNQHKWNDLKPQNYSVTVNYGTFGGIYTHYRETVTDGVAWRSDSRFALDQPTIDELFDKIKGNTFDPLALLLYEIEYDPTYSYPIRVSEVDFDLGRITEIKDFTPE